MDFEENTSDYEAIRAQNMKALEAMMSEFITPDIENSIEAINSFTQQETFKKEKKRKRRDGDDETFRCQVMLPLETRRSSRLANINPTYTYLDLPEDKFEKNFDVDDIENLEKQIYKRRKTTVNRSQSTPCEIVPVEAITPEYLKNVASRVTVKTYSQNGTSCHQCRQKTTDSKTYCRSGRCVGVRGQFCGVCLKNRYGEEAKEALMNPKWECPPCRGLCNCSICRTRQGKRPTGILAPIAFKYGHKSVKDFLLSLNGYGDYVNDDGKKKKLEITVKKEKRCLEDCNHLNLIGFNDNNHPIFMFVSEIEVCDWEGDLLGFNNELKPILSENID